MLLPETDPNDVFNPHLRQEALASQERGDGVFVWHGRDEFSGEDVEVLIALESRTGGIALGDTVVACQIGEQGNQLVLAPKNPARGRIMVDIDAETLPMNLERTGCEAFNDGETASVRLFDRLTREDILSISGDEVHELVDQKHLDPKDYQGSAFTYAKSIGLL